MPPRFNHLKIRLKTGLLLLFIVGNLPGVQPLLGQPLPNRLQQLADSAHNLRDANHDSASISLLRAALQNPDYSPLVSGRLMLLYELGLSERKRNQYAAGATALKQADRLAHQLRDTTQLYRVGYGIVIMYADQGDYSRAVRHCHATLPYCTLAYNPEGALNILLLLSEIYQRVGD